jgi:peptidoglycan/xylan/chitin deacetylase (PgdA/CDA1 family)
MITAENCRAVLRCFTVSLALLASPAHALEHIPEKLVVLTFDDSVASHHAVVRPILKRLGFGATFFITEGFSFRTNKVDYMTWEQIAELHHDGFEIGNHTRDHLGVSPDTLGRLGEQVEAINARCAEHGIPHPVSFAYPGNAIAPGAPARLKELGFEFARRGGEPEHPYQWGRGFAYEPGVDHPLLIPSAGDARPDWTLADFKRAADQARDGRIAVLQFHGVPDRDHPWVHTDPRRFEEFMSYLKTNAFTVVALRDLARYVDADQVPAEPFAVIERRKQARPEVLVEGRITDAATGKALPGRIYIQDANGGWHFPKSTSLTAPAIRYERKSSFSADAVEMHTTLAAQPFRIELLPGRHTVRVEHGKEFFPELRVLEVKAGMAPLEIKLRRWSDVAAQGWYSGDAHNHRNPAELANVLLAEDVNVGLPMVDWTTVEAVAPTASGRGFAGEFGDRPIKVDATHVWHPRNTEYEIFQTAGRSHTLGAFLIVNHKTRFDLPTFPLRDVAAKARAEGALIDLEKHNWPWSIAVVPLLGVDLFELANNHHWAVEFGVRNWAEPAPAWMNLPDGGNGIDTERAWTHYGFQTYYALLNCGFNLRPTAGTANGVHPVPLGFSRVYVHVDGEFSYEKWIEGLGAGRSFVTTGPMLLANLDGQRAGGRFQQANGKTYQLSGEILSEQPLESIEVVRNGDVVLKLAATNEPTAAGAFRNRLSGSVPVNETSWIAVRCFEARPNGRFRFAHTAPWHIQHNEELIRPKRQETDWLIGRVKGEIARSEALLPPAGRAEYQESLRAYEEIAKRAR